MRRFRNILAVYNETIGAEDALTQAATLAHANRARLTLVDVFSQNRCSRAELREREKCLQRTVKALKLDGIEHVTAEILVGTDFLEIVRHVLKAENDLVIASAEGGSAVRNAFYGSLATQLMRKCPCPVWIVKLGQTLLHGRILAAVDPDLSNSAKDAVNVEIMDLATSLATSHDAELHVLHAWDVTGNDRDTVNSEIEDTTRTLLLQKHEGIYKADVEALLERYELSRIPHFVHLPRGLPEREIMKAVKAHDIDLILMGTAYRSGLSRLLIGNAVESILAAVRCGVLTVKPEGFVSPILLEEPLEGRVGGGARAGVASRRSPQTASSANRVMTGETPHGG